jgi:Na+/H+ antiporter NhaD/arsenite permease-like protein
VAFAAGANLAWASIAGAAVVMLLRGRDSGPLFSRVSWTVLVFFAALFILVAGLQKAGVPRAALEAAAPHLPRNEIAALGTLSLALVVGCQIISNVPFILLIEPMIKTLPDPVTAWTVAAVVSTLAGNLTLLGSVANIIVVESAGAEKDLGFRAYVRVGAPVTLVSTMVALGWLWLTMPVR